MSEQTAHKLPVPISGWHFVLCKSRVNLEQAMSVELCWALLCPEAAAEGPRQSGCISGCWIMDDRQQC